MCWVIYDTTRYRDNLFSYVCLPVVDLYTKQTPGL